MSNFNFESCICKYCVNIAENYQNNPSLKTYFIQFIDYFNFPYILLNLIMATVYVSQIFYRK